MQEGRTCMGMSPIHENMVLAHQLGLTSHSITKHRMKNDMTTIRSHNCSRHNEYQCLQITS